MFLRDHQSDFLPRRRIAAIEFQRVHKTFMHQSRLPVSVLRNASVSIEAGSMTAIVGESGSGKSTSAHLAAGLDTDYQGVIRFFGLPVPHDEGPELCSHRSSIGFVSQSFNLVSALSAGENVALALIARGVARGSALEAAHLQLRSLGLDPRASNRPSQLSGGERQRVAIARALAVGNRVIIADEPTGNLDRRNEDLVLEAFQLAVREGRTVVIVTHSPRVSELSDQVVRVEHGSFETVTDEIGAQASIDLDLQPSRLDRRWSRLV